MPDYVKRPYTLHGGPCDGQIEYAYCFWSDVIGAWLPQDVITAVKEEPLSFTCDFNPEADFTASIMLHYYRRQFHRNGYNTWFTFHYMEPEK